MLMQRVVPVGFKTAFQIPRVGHRHGPASGVEQPILSIGRPLASQVLRDYRL